jgi:hypothetical protein
MQHLHVFVQMQIEFAHLVACDKNLKNISVMAGPSASKPPGWGGSSTSPPPVPPWKASTPGSAPRRPGEPESSSSFHTGNWAEDDEGEMDFNKPIVIPASNAAAMGDSKGGTSSGRPSLMMEEEFDPIEEAKRQARRKQQQLERMQEEMREQQRRAEIEEHERAREQERMREQRQREEQENARRMMEEDRRRREEERVAAEERRRTLEAQRIEERRRFEETERERAQEMRLRQQETARRAEEARLLREQELETVKNQTLIMKESMQASWSRRQEEEHRAELERVARLESRLRELDRKKEEREAAERREREERERVANERAELEAQMRAQRLEQQRQEQQRMELERDDQQRQDQQRYYQQQQPPSRPDDRAEHVPWQHPRDGGRDGRPDIADNRGGAGQHFGGFSRGPAGGGPRRLYDPKQDRFVVESEEPGFLRKQMAEREAAREQAEKTRQEAMIRSVMPAQCRSCTLHMDMHFRLMAHFTCVRVYACMSSSAIQIHDLPHFARALFPLFRTGNLDFDTQSIATLAASKFSVSWLLK